MSYIFIPEIYISDINFDTAVKNTTEEILELIVKDGIEVIDCNDSFPAELQNMKFDAIAPIPKEYYSFDKWIAKSEFACWTCGCYFDGPPWFVPASWTRQLKKIDKPLNYSLANCEGNDMHEVNVIRVHGNFCNAFCVRRFIEESTDISHKESHLNMLYILYKEFTGKDVDYIPMSPSKTIMKKYCGPKGVTEEEYKKMNANLANNLKYYK